MVVPWGQSRRDIITQHPTARAAPVVIQMRGVGSKARDAASTAPRLRTVNVARRITARVRGQPGHRAGEQSRAPWSGKASGAPSTCNSARLRICESVGMQRLWVGGRCQPRGVLRRSSGGSLS